MGYGEQIEARASEQESERDSRQHKKLTIETSAVFLSKQSASASAPLGEKKL
jgi:hypothetical protein